MSGWRESVRFGIRSLLPLDRVLIRGVCKNRLTGEKQVLRIRTAALPKAQTRQSFFVSSETCGVLQLTLSEAVVYDPFGLFCFRVPLQGEADTLVRPELYPSELSVLYGESMSLDSEEYSMKRAGFDPSETFAIREYRAGDGIRQIHWKLSEKLETLMVRDYGLPIQNTILLLLETGYAPGGEKPEPACISALAEGLLSVSESLGQMQLTHSIGWQDHETGSFSCMEIDETEDRTLSMAGLLNAACGEDPESVLEHYLEGHEQMEVCPCGVIYGRSNRRGSCTGGTLYGNRGSLYPGRHRDIGAGWCIGMCFFSGAACGDDFLS